MAPSLPPGEVRLAELLAALSLAIDLGMGQPQEHVMRTTLLAVALARELGVNDSTISDVYYTTLVRLVGCTADAHETARLASGDDLAFRAEAAVMTMGDPSAMASLARFGGSLGARHHRLAGRFATARREALTAHCEVGERLAEQLGLPDGVCHAVRCAFSYWDGRGVPENIAGEAIPLAARIAAVARDVEIVARVSGLDAAFTLARDRRGKAYDPGIVAALERCKPVLHEDRDVQIWDATLEAEPRPRRVTPPRQVTSVLTAFAFFADLKSPYTAGHSPSVAALAAAGGKMLGLGDAEVATLERAGLVHDLGRTGVPNGIWDKPRALTPLEWERVRLHPYLSERILQRCAPLRPLARLAGAHHERLDGSGYYRGSGGADLSLSQRLLAAADVYRAMSEPRPHRPPRSAATIQRNLRAEVAADRLDRRAVDAVVAAATGTRWRHSNREGLTTREIDVLRCICEGRSNREVAQQLGISPKTVGHHIQHIYEKFGVKSRAAVTLSALQRGLLEA